MGQQVKILPIENVLTTKRQAVTRNNRHNTGSPEGPPASFSRATKQRLRCHRQPLKQYSLSRPALGCFGALVVPPHWPPQSPASGRQSTSQPVVLHFQCLPGAREWVGGGGDAGTTTPRRLCTEGVITTEDAGGGASWDEAGARCAGTSVAAVGDRRAFPS